MNKQLLSLALLTSIACTTVTKDHHRRDDDTCDRDKEVSFERKFSINLSFDQELVAGENGGFSPRPADDAPRKVSGRIEISLAKDLSSLSYRLFVFGAKGKDNPNEKISMAHFHAGSAFENGPVVATLFNNDGTFGCGKAVNGLLSEGTLTNADIIPLATPGLPAINSIASLVDAIRRGTIYVNVHGSDTCDAAQPGYAGGILRGQVYGNTTG